MFLKTEEPISEPNMYTLLGFKSFVLSWSKRVPLPRETHPNLRVSRSSSIFIPLRFSSSNLCSALPSLLLCSALLFSSFLPSPLLLRFCSALLFASRLRSHTHRTSPWSAVLRRCRSLFTTQGVRRSAVCCSPRRGLRLELSFAVHHHSATGLI